MQKLDPVKNALSLVILAAGLGSRFGGNKPLAAVGPDGQSLFEYSVYDAFRAGFNHVVFVVSDGQDTSEFSARLKGYGDKLKIEFVVQSLVIPRRSSNGSESWNGKLFSAKINGISSPRTKPWGTAHAVLACREHIHNPFVVINADDYYGQKNYENIGHYLLANRLDPKACVLPGYKLMNTLSSSGGVNRGICSVDSDGYLEFIQEVTNITCDQSLAVHADKSDGDVPVCNDSIVSMTFWGFVPSVFNILENEFQAFVNNTRDLQLDEFYLPDAVNAAMQSGLLRVKVLDTSERWKGLTHTEDTAVVRRFVFELTEAGLYSGMRS